jgi:uncharacterized protein YdeI (YjbR/CyaY-like superfamily)
MKALYANTKTEWRSWLAKHHNKEKEVWLIYYKADTGKPRISYEDAVREALCYGWIDSVVRSVDRERFAQKFTPRRRTSALSQPNKERVRELIKQKKMTSAGLKAIAHAFDPKTDRITEKLEVPPYIQKALKANQDAWKYFQKFPARYKRIRIAYIESQKKHSKEQHLRALRNFVNKTAQNKRIGIMKDMK